MKAILFIVPFIAVMHIAVASQPVMQAFHDPFMPQALEGKGYDKQLVRPDPEDYDFYRAIGLLQGICSTSFIKTSDDLSAPAYLLSAGHCVQELDALADNRIVVNESVELSASFNMFFDTLNDKILVNIDQIAYSTMKGVDISLLRTDKTIAELQTLSLRPFTLSRRVPLSGEGVITAGLPNGYAVSIEPCVATNRVDLVEGMWHFNGFQEITCRLIGGMSGGPTFLTDKAGRPTQIVAASSTAADDRLWLGTPCHTNNPCVAKPDGFVQVNNLSYVVPTVGIQDCFNNEGVFELTHAGCPLPVPTDVIIENHPVEITGASAAAENQTWNFTPQHPSGALKVKMIRVRGSSDTCQSMTDYTPVVLPGFDPSQERIPVQQEGIYQYCLLQADSLTAENAEVIMVKVDNTPTQTKPIVTVMPGTGNALRVFFSFILNENAVHKYTFGPLDTFTCPVAGSDSYKETGETTFVDVPYSRVKVCSYLDDPAFNKGPVYEVDYPAEGKNQVK